MRRIPILPTLLVLSAVAVMIALGFWQLGRMHQKEALLAVYATAANSSAANPTVEVLPAMPRDKALLYRRASLFCKRVTGWDNVAGYDARGQMGWALVAHCITGSGDAVPGQGDIVAPGDVVIGWSRELKQSNWAGGEVTGTLAPGYGGTIRLIADPPLSGLAANARPDPHSIPNNHLSYAVQWFLFALTALVIYALVLRKRLAAKDAAG